MKQSVELTLLVLVFCGEFSAKAQEQEKVFESDPESADSTDVDEQNGTNQPADGSRVGRIFYGVQTTIDKYPYAAFISVDGSAQSIRLVGAIISNTQVLTSASGLLQAGNITSISVTVGSTTSNDGAIFYHKSYAIHSGFVESTLANDVAFITIDGSFAGLTNVVPISLPTSDITISSTNRTKCTIVGWGLYESYDYSSFLRVSSYELMTSAECTAVTYLQTPSIVCGRSVAGHACTGDGGAPLVCNQQLYGILTIQKTCDMTPNSGFYIFAKLPAINLQGYLAIDSPVTAPRKNYVSCA